MKFPRRFVQSTLAALAVASSALLLPATSTAGVGLVTTSDLYGNWVLTFSGFTGCGNTAMQATILMNSTGTGTGTLTTHGQCGDSTVAGQTFRIVSLSSTGAGTANLTCGAGCGWNLRIQVSPDRQIMNLVDVDPVNPGNYIAGTGVHY